MVSSPVFWTVRVLTLQLHYIVLQCNETWEDLPSRPFVARTIVYSVTSTGLLNPEWWSCVTDNSVWPSSKLMVRNTTYRVSMSEKGPLKLKEWQKHGRVSLSVKSCFTVYDKGVMWCSEIVWWSWKQIFSHQKWKELSVPHHGEVWRKLFEELQYVLADERWLRNGGLKLQERWQTKQKLRGSAV